VSHGFTPEQVARFRAAVKVDRDGGRHIFRGDLMGQGGCPCSTFVWAVAERASGKAHRVAWCLHHDVGLDGLPNIHRRCRNPECVAPEHLMLRTERLTEEYLERVRTCRRVTQGDAAVGGRVIPVDDLDQLLARHQLLAITFGGKWVPPRA
jgi:hypothetical protein